MRVLVWETVAVYHTIVIIRYHFPFFVGGAERKSKRSIPLGSFEILNIK